MTDNPNSAALREFLLFQSSAHVFSVLSAADRLRATWQTKIEANAHLAAEV